MEATGGANRVAMGTGRAPGTMGGTTGANGVAMGARRAFGKMGGTAGKGGPMTHVAMTEMDQSWEIADMAIPLLVSSR